MGLEEYYDDKVWKQFATFYTTKVLSESDSKRLNEFGYTAPEQLETLSVAVAYFGFDSTRRWLDLKIEVLDWKTARECLEDDQLIKRLREALTRMP